MSDYPPFGSQGSGTASDGTKVGGTVYGPTIVTHESGKPSTTTHVTHDKKN